MVKRWKVTEPGTTPGREPPVEVVLAADYAATEHKRQEAQAAWDRLLLANERQCDMIAAREKRIAALEAALLKHGRHHPHYCADGICRCGYEAALAPPTGEG